MHALNGLLIETNCHPLQQNSTETTHSCQEAQLFAMALLQMFRVLSYEDLMVVVDHCIITCIKFSMFIFLYSAELRLRGSICRNSH
mmetsp:Transcript_27603/g.40730  ORF Transcript_27603/g.40730 Transcript_27603/m.40730 type:complete len:86 (-) Transcript_27603:915-1172(-)